MNHSVKDPLNFILRNKRDVSRLQILVEIIEHQPAVRQQDIARKLGFTPQAISEYIRDLVDLGKVSVNGRGNYEVTQAGIEWMIANAESLASYSRHIRYDLIHHVSVWTAIADGDLKAGEEAGMYMQNGFLYAAKKPSPATGTVIADAYSGADVGITNLTGVIEHHVGIVQICKVPRIQYGGSRNVQLDQLREIVAKVQIVAAVGLEAYIALKSLGREPDLFFGARDSTIEAAHYGMDCAIVITDDVFTDVINRLEDAKISYVAHDLITSSGRCPVSSGGEETSGRAGGAVFFHDVIGNQENGP